MSGWQDAPISLSADERRALEHLMYEAAEMEDVNPFVFSVHVYDPAYLEERRRIKSFFIQEVDRDKVVLAGCP